MNVMNHTFQDIESMYTHHGESELLGRVAEKLSNKKKKLKQLYMQLFM